MRFVLFLVAVSALAFAVAFITPSTPYSTDQWIMASGAALAIVAAGALVWLTRNPFASVAVLPAVITAALVGNFLPYQLGLWDLSAQDYGSSDQSGVFRFAFLLAWCLLGTVAAGLVLGLLTDAAHLILGARFWPGTGDDGRGGLHPG